MKPEKKPAAPSDDEVLKLGTEFVLSVLSSVDTDRISPRDWWERAKTALETSAGCAESYSQMVSRAGAKLQVAALSATSGAELTRIERAIGLEFERFRALCERDALYVVALARAERDRRKKQPHPPEEKRE